jgi:pimeloyl-ACP methyl ester carboxylesterase
MKKTAPEKPSFILPLEINGLKGRVLKMPAQKKDKREILLIYGHHSSLERMYGMAEHLANYGNVTMPDLPGFGGMDSYYKLGEKPTLDNLADYLATFIKLNYRNKRIIVGGMSFGFVIVTKMLQKYPQLAKQIDLLVAIAGFSHAKDFKLKKRTLLTFRYTGIVFSNRWPAAFAKYVALKKPLIKLTYYILASKNSKIKDADSEERRRRINFEAVLWQCNDIRTYMETTVTMMKLDLTKQKVGSLPLFNITVGADQYFNHRTVIKHFKQIYDDVKTYEVTMPNHAPTVISTAEEVKFLFTKEICQALNRAPKY